MNKQSLKIFLVNFVFPHISVDQFYCAFINEGGRTKAKKGFWKKTYRKINHLGTLRDLRSKKK